MILPPLRSLRAGVDSQREWTGEALISAPRGEIRLITLLNSDVDALNRSSLTTVAIFGRRGAARVEFFCLLVAREM